MDEQYPAEAPFGEPVVTPKPECTTTRDRLKFIIDVNKEMVVSTQKVLDIIEMFPEADEHFARVFGVQPTPKK